MTESSINNLELKEINPTPVGEVVLGSQDPSTLTPEQFSSSPELLFHGTPKSFHFSRDYNYDAMNINDSHSHTVGSGFYTTLNPHDAYLFAEVFRLSENDPLTVAEILPYQAKMFDFRSSTNPEKNAPVPTDMLIKYKKHVNDIYDKLYGNYDSSQDYKWLYEHPNSNTPDLNRRENPQTIDDYFATLPDEFSAEREFRNTRLNGCIDFKHYLEILSELPLNNTDLREMLSITGYAGASEYSAGIFPEFVRNMGLDGIIYIEGGDHPDHKNPVSYIFYNLSKIGSYDTWHQDN